MSQDSGPGSRWLAAVILSASIRTACVMLGSADVPTDGYNWLGWWTSCAVLCVLCRLSKLRELCGRGCTFGLEHDIFLL